MNYFIPVLLEHNNIGEGEVVWWTPEAEDYWSSIYQQLQGANPAAMVKAGDNPINRLVALAMREPYELERRAVHLLNLEFKRRIAEPEHDRLLETLQRVINKRRSQACEDAQLLHNPNLHLAYASPQKLKKHVWDEDGDGCTTCNDDYSYVVAMLLRSLATVKKKPTVN